jgi:hypothetical protein
LLDHLVSRSSGAFLSEKRLDVPGPIGLPEILIVVVVALLIYAALFRRRSS